MRFAARTLQHANVTSLLRSCTLHKVVPRRCSPLSLGVHPARLISGSLARLNVTKTIVLRPYQEECIQAVLKHVDEGKRRLGVSLATGSGKTVIFSHLIDRIRPPTDDATQTLIIAHRQELVNQSAIHCRALYPDKSVEIDMGPQKASGLADITVASVLSLASGDRMIKYDHHRFKLILVDEAHHAAASSYRRIFDYFGLLNGHENVATTLVGFSATLSRADGLSLGVAIDHIAYHKDYLEMMEDGWLANAVFTTVESGADLSKVKSMSGDFQISSLSNAVNNEASNAITVRAWLAKAGARKSTLVFCVDLDHVRSLTAAFRDHGVDARFVTSKSLPQDRRGKLDEFKAGKYPVLLNCGIYTEGTDIPNVDCVLLARPTKSRNLLVQMIGRGLRLHEGKQDCHVIDMVASLETGVVTVPTLLGLDPSEVIDGADGKRLLESLTLRQESERLREEEVSSTTSRSSADLQALSGDVTFTDYANVNELIGDTSGERHIRRVSPCSWVEVREHCFILSSYSKSGDYLRLDQDAERFNVWFYQKLPSGSSGDKLHMRPRLIGTADTFEHGVKAADGFARAAKQTFLPSLIRSSAPWRRKPASEGQISFLNKKRHPDNQLETGSITKGKASDWITKLVHGAAGRYNKAADAKRKAKKLQDKKTSHHNTKVRVGPLAR